MSRVVALLALIACGPSTGGPKDTAKVGEPVPGEFTSLELTPVDPTPVDPTPAEEPVDADGDGYLAGDDCDDDDPSSHPGAEDVVYDGVDQDCLGDDDYDADRDGYASDVYGGADCADADPAVNGGAVPVCGDGIDNDCDAMSDCLRGDVWIEDVAAGWYTGTENSYAGSYLDLEDFDADGDVDLLLMGGSSDQTWLFNGPLLEERGPDQADAVLSGGAQGGAFGDFDGDGLLDVVTTSQSLFFGSTTTFWSGPALVEDAPLAQLIHAPGDAQTLARTMAADVDGDGFDDLLLGAVTHCGISALYWAGRGCTVVYSGPFEGDFDDAAVASVIYGEDNLPWTDYPGVSMDADSDLTGDGIVDLAIVDPLIGDRGAVYLVETPLPEVTLLEDAPTKLVLDPAVIDAGAAVTATGDLDGDGHNDLLAATTGFGIWEGTAWVFRGPISGDVTEADAWVTLTGLNTLNATFPGDMDGDGSADLVLGTSFEDPVSGLLEYSLQIFYAPQGVMATADGRVRPRDYGNGADTPMAAGDVDGDGLADVVSSWQGLLDNGLSTGGAVTLLGQSGF